jgi:hypothetical protein
MSRREGRFLENSREKHKGLFLYNTSHFKRQLVTVHCEVHRRVTAKYYVPERKGEGRED